MDDSSHNVAEMTMNGDVAELSSGDLIVTARSIHRVTVTDDGEVFITTYKMTSTWNKPMTDFNEWRQQWKNAQLIRPLKQTT